MECSSLYTIAMRDLPIEGATFSWHLDDSFFEALDQHEIEHGSLDATLRVEQKADAFELNVDIKGTVEIPCDRCLEPMTQPIHTEATLKAKLGETYEDDGEVITVASDKAELDIAWNLYELIALNIPIYHTHPEGECREEINNLFAARQGEDAPPTDERWEALRSLLSDKQ